MLSTVKDLCTLSEGAMHIRISDGIERVDQESLSLEDGQRFLKHSHLTAGMIEMVREGFKRLSGSEGGRPVFRLKQAMGGGKTHLIRTLAFVARHTALREEFFPETNSRYKFGETRVTFFNGREQPDDFFWGRIAGQLGFEGFFEPGVKAPGENHWAKLFEAVGSDKPVLILLDEMPTYFSYYRTQASGQGTVADVAGRAFANLLSCVIAQKNICVVVSDLEASHSEGSQVINASLENARKELSRVEFNITPVDLSGNETYAILRKRIFAHLPDEAQIGHIAQQFSIAIANAQQSKSIDMSKSPEQLAQEVQETYPFHPQMKHIFALFKENKEFQQTRGLMELTSRLVRSVWERQSNDVLLIGPQHFDLSIDEVREKVISISRLDDAVARDIYSSDGSAHAQTLDANSGNDAAMQAANLLLISSLSTAVNPVKGLRMQEALACLVAPNADLSFFKNAIESLRGSCWYLHKSVEERIYFDKVENMKKMLESMAEKAPEPKIVDLISHRLTQMFAPKRKTAYAKVLALPRIEDLENEVQSGRVLAIISPNSKLPPDEVARLFAGMVRKNNLIILSGERTFDEGKMWESARMLYAVSQAEALKRIEKGGPQWEEFEEAKRGYEQNFNGVLKTLFDRLLFPFQKTQTSEPELVGRPLEQIADSNDGEARIEATLTKDPIKLYVDWQDSTRFSAVRSRLERLFKGVDEIAKTDLRDRTQTDCAMYFLPPGDFDKVLARAINEGNWEDLNNGWITRKPKPKLVTVSVFTSGRMSDAGDTTLDIEVVNAKPSSTTVYFEEDGEVSVKSRKLADSKLTTSALRVSFLAVDNTGIAESAPPKVWENKLVIQHHLGSSVSGKREVNIVVLPSASVVRYSLNGVEPRNGVDYSGAFKVDNTQQTLMVFAESEGVESKMEFLIPEHRSTTSRPPTPPIGSGGSVVYPPDLPTPPHVPICPPLNKPCLFPQAINQTITARDKLFLSMEKAQQRNVVFSEARLTASDEHNQSAQLQLSSKAISAQNLFALIVAVTGNFDPSANLTLHIKKARFETGQDLMDFCEVAGLDFDGHWVEMK